MTMPVPPAAGTIDAAGLAALRESEEAFRLTFMHAAVGMAHVGLKGEWLRVNPAMCRMLGYSEMDLRARDFQSITHPDDLAAGLELAQQMLLGEIDRFEVEKRYLHVEGHVVPVRLVTALQRDSAGRPLRYISTMFDLTERKSLEAERDRAIR